MRASRTFAEAREARHRAELLDEAQEVVAGLWTGKPFAFRSEHFEIGEVTFLPKPVQEPRIPIWVGGGYPNRWPVQRALRWDGACLYKVGGRDMTPDDVRDLRGRAAERPFTITTGGRARADDWEADREHIRAVAGAGADWWAEYVPPAEQETMRAGVLRGPLRIH